MGLAPEVKLVIKHTFLEYVGDSKVSSDHSLTRRRSQTEPDIFKNIGYGEVRELLHGSDSSSSSSHQGDSTTDDLDASFSSRSEHTNAVLATPEATPLLYPMARHLPGWLQEDWAEGLLPEAFSAPHSMGEFGQWNEQYGICEWWTPAPVALPGMARDDQYELPGAMGYAQFQVELPSTDQVYMSMAINAELDAPHGAKDTAAIASAANDSWSKETRTTVMLRELPEAYSRSSLLKLLDAHGFFGRFDFVYLPVDFKHQRNLGYALINLVSPSEALRLTAHFEGFRSWGFVSDKICNVGWCSPQQGLEAHVERYRNSPVMHETVPEEWRPMLLSHGVPIPFPPPTMKIKAPKVKGRQT